jgi:hypothetical protein
MLLMPPLLDFLSRLSLLPLRYESPLMFRHDYCRFDVFDIIADFRLLLLMRVTMRVERCLLMLLLSASEAP